MEVVVVVDEGMKLKEADYDGCYYCYVDCFL